MKKEKINRETETRERSIFEKMGGSYIEVGEYLLPKITLHSEFDSEEDKRLEDDTYDDSCDEDNTGGHLGKYGLLRKEYLMKHKKAKFQIMTLQNRLDKHLAEVDAAAREMEEVILCQLEREVTMPDKGVDQMAWVKIKNQHKEIAEEIILADMIYV